MKVSDLRPGERVSGRYAVLRKGQMRDYRSKKGRYFFLRVGDDTGDIALKYWGGPDPEETLRIYRTIEEGSVVHVEGTCIIDEYTGSPAIKVDPGISQEVRPVPVSEYSKGEFIPRGKVPCQELLTRLHALLGLVKDRHIQRLLDVFFTDEGFLRRFVESPAGAKRHHNYIGGLLEHTVNIAETCVHIHRHYPDMDLDLLVAGALLRNIGMVREFDVRASIVRTEEGDLLGHAVISDEMLVRAGERVQDIPDATLGRLRHLVLAAGRTGWGSLVPPRTPEALTIYLAEQMDCMLNRYIRTRAGLDGVDGWRSERDTGSDLLPGGGRA